VELFKADRNSVGHCGVVYGYTEIYFISNLLLIAQGTSERGVRVTEYIQEQAYSGLSLFLWNGQPERSSLESSSQPSTGSSGRVSLKGGIRGKRNSSSVR